MRLQVKSSVDNVVLNVMLCSILLNTQRYSSPDRVGGGMAGMKDSLTYNVMSIHTMT